MNREEVLALAKKISKEVRAQRASNLLKVELLIKSIGEPEFLEATEEWLYERMKKEIESEQLIFRQTGEALIDLVGWFRGWDTEEERDEP